MCLCVCSIVKVSRGRASTLGGRTVKVQGDHQQTESWDWSPERKAWRDHRASGSARTVSAHTHTHTLTVLKVKAWARHTTAVSVTLHTTTRCDAEKQNQCYAAYKGKWLKDYKFALSRILTPACTFLMCYCKSWRSRPSIMTSSFSAIVRRRRKV